ncbi:MAG: hypothetical protein IJX00_00560 [Clostridia bacterium]|nr:hypothetical protein [Clostridia bacterium]
MTKADIIVAPTIAEGIEIALFDCYEDKAGTKYNTLTSVNANQTLNLYVEPPATDDKVVSVPTFVAVLLGVLVLAAGVVAILFARAPKKKNAFEIIMSVLKNNL